MKVVAPMVRGQVAYDEVAVAAAGRVFSMHSGSDLVALFEDENTQAAPSEAGPAIWSDPEQFAELSERLQSLGADLTSTAASPEYTADVFAQIGQTCVACHEDYRVKRD
jgi:cytochrome c556